MKKGEKHWRLTAIRYYGKDKQRCILWKFKCDCGRTHVTRACQAKSGRTKSCGCYRTDVCRERGKYINKSHGMWNTPTYISWAKMKHRCKNVKDKALKKYYRERNIKYCRRWEKFENFLADMGERPNGTSIDRIDNNGNYEPNNCRWATQKEQVNNSRICLETKKCHMLLDGNIVRTFNSQKEASEALNVHQQNINKVLNGKRKSCGGYQWSY